jgi:uncharacterized protein (TIGR03083 family)
MAELEAAYVETYEHLLPILRGLSAEQLATTVPFSPEWSVLDVVAHMTSEGSLFTRENELPAGVFELSESAREERARAINAMNAGEVGGRRGSTLDELLDEWESYQPVLRAQLRGERPFPNPVPGQEYIAVVDLAMHAQDIRNVVGCPGDRDSAGVGMALPSFGFVTAMRISEVGLPALELRYGEKSRVLGDGETGATVTASRYELVRALANRRSTAQIRAYDWIGDPEPYLPIIPAYQARDDNIVE